VLDYFLKKWTYKMNNTSIVPLLTNLDTVGLVTEHSGRFA
jgi:hypothetical protein